MTTTLDLLEKALSIRNANQWAHTLGVSRSAFTKAKERHRLSPTLAGAIAADLGEDVTQWVAIAALEAEPPTPLMERVRGLASHYFCKALSAYRPRRSALWMESRKVASDTPHASARSRCNQPRRQHRAR